MALVDPRVGFFAEETQRINNRLPQWHAGRRLRTSNWASIVNSLAGETLADIREQQSRAFRNLYLQTAKLDEPDIIRRASLPANLDLNPTVNNTNILKNSNFALRSRPDKVGDYWEHSGTVNVGTGLFGTRSAQLTPEAGETSRIYQTISQRDEWGVGDSRTFSCWYKIAQWTAGTIPSDSHGLIVAVTYHDNTTGTFRAAFSAHTSNKWKRLTHTVTPTKSVAKYEVRLETKRSGTFPINIAVSVDGIQAQSGTAATAWTPNLFDQPHWFFSQRVYPVQLDASSDIFITNSLRDFSYEAVPTRLSLKKTTSTTNTANRSGGLSTLVDYHGNRWLAEWGVNATTNKVVLTGLEPQDKYLSADISFFTGTDTGPKYEEGVASLDYMCGIKFGHWAWIIHEMPGLNGDNETVLSVCSPRVSYPYPSYLESVYTLTLPIDTDTDYHSIEFRFEDPQHIYIATATEEFMVQLHYDYAMIDEQTLELFLRESYNTLAVVQR